MADINISSNGGPVTVDFTFQTPQVFNYVIKVVDNDLNEYFSDSGGSQGKTHFNLGASAVIGRTLQIDWGAIDPQGAGNTVSAIAIAKQDGSACAAAQAFTGTSKVNILLKTTYGKFI